MSIARIQLDEKWYLIELPSFRGRDLVDFSPRASTAGGSILHSELGLYQIISQSDWRHGFGFPWWITESGYEVTQGRVDTRHPGKIMLFGGEQTATMDPHNAMLGYQRFGTNLYAWSASAAVRLLSSADGKTWVQHPDQPSTGAVRYIWENGTYIFAAVHDDRIYYAPLPVTVWTATGVDATAKDYAWIESHNGFVYAGVRNTNRVHYSSELDLSDLEGTTSDPGAIYVGKKGGKTLGMFALLGQAYIVTDHGFYRLEHEQGVAVKVLDFRGEFKGSQSLAGRYAVHNSMLMISTGDAVYQWNGVRLSDVTPNLINGIYPFVTHGNFGRMFVVKTDLFMFAKRSNGNVYDLLVWDGASWHIVASNIATAMPSAAFYDPVKQLYMFDHAIATIPTTQYLELQEQSRYLVKNFPTTGEHSLTTSRMDAGFRRVTKSTPSIIMEAYNLTNTRYIDIHYRKDGGQTWIPWGGVNGFTNRVKADGVTELPFRDESASIRGGDLSSIEYKHIQFRFKLVTDLHTESPIIENFLIRLIMRPDTNFGYGFNVIVASPSSDTFSDSMVDDRSPLQIIQDLRRTRQKKNPVNFIDPFEVKSKVYISALNEQSVEYRSDRAGADPIIEGRVFVNVVGVGHGGLE